MPEPGRCRPLSGVIVAAAIAAAAVTARAQDETPRPVLAAPGDTANVVAGPEYRISGPLGWLDRWLFGARYRALWSDTLRVPVLDLRTLGAAHPTGADTLAAVTQLRLADSTHTAYTFRLTNPRLAPIVPANKRTAEVVGPLQDLVSGLHPGAPTVAAPLARAVGLSAASPIIAVLPYDSALGAYTDAFGGRLGYLRADPAGDAADAITTATLGARLDSGSVPPVDERAFLLSRLFDVYVGQTHFAPSVQPWRVEDGRWRPVPLGRDLAFARFDGLLARLARVAMPMLTVFDDRYPKGLGESKYQLNVDRRFLGGLTWTVWDSLSRAMQAELTDSSIEAAVGALPTPWAAQSGPMLVHALEMRRDHLPAAARSLYSMVAERADVYVPDDADSIVVERNADGALDVAVPPDFHRRFLTAETKDVRLFLGRNRPVVLVRGAAARRGPSLRVVTGSGGAILIDSSAAGARRLTVNDSAGRAMIDTSSSRIPPHLSHGAFARPEYAGITPVRPVDGARYAPIIWFDAFGNLGLLLGGGVERTGYEGNYTPYRTRQSIRIGYAVAPRQYAVQYHGDFRFHVGSVRLYVDADRTGFALLRFYGLGNNTVDTALNLRFYTSSQVETRLAPSLAWHLASGDTLAAGVVYKRVTTDTTANNFINHDRPFGWPTFQELGAQFAYLHDTRDSPVAPRRGLLLTATGKYFPGLLDANGAFGGVGCTISTYWSPIDSGGLTIAARAGAQKIWGPYPAFEAAFIGGEGTVAGLPPQRYAGDASAFGTIEARVRLLTLPFVMPWDFGVSGIVDAGRVYVSGEKSNTWHKGIGGGVWLLLPARTFGLILDVVGSEGNTRVYGGTRFSY